MQKNNKFKKIGLFASKMTNKQLIVKIKQILKHLNCKLTLNPNKLNIIQHLDLIIVIGGDGSLLGTARKIANANIPIIGIHTGKLGFLADLNTNQIESELTAILNGQYKLEKRSLLQAKLKSSKNIINCALNDVTLYNGATPKLMEFAIFIDNNLVINLRADGLIVATPTGSTAYSLSAGGPILYPTLKAFNLVPMSPHTLSSRPIVINDASSVTIKILDHPNNSNCGLGFDGQKYINLAIYDEITISKYPYELKLIHPDSYDYFTTLREKLNWHKY